MTANGGGFRTEGELAQRGQHLIQEALRRFGTRARSCREVAAPGAVADLVIYYEMRHAVTYVITIEFKLSNWRRAVAQAFRHRNFGNEAYVVLDCTRAEGALRHLCTFERANVGLATLDREDRVEVWHYPLPRTPFSPEFARLMTRVLLPPSESMPRDLRFTRSIRGGVALAELRRAWGLPRERSCGV
jgi:hypothetical protein